MTWNGNSLTLAPGETGSRVLSVTPPESAADSSYEMSMTVTATDGLHPESVASASYVLNARPPAAVTDLTGSLDRKGFVQLFWSRSPDGLGFASSYRVWRNRGAGFQWLADTPGLSFTDTDTLVTADTTFAYYVVAADSCGHESDPGNVVNVLIKARTKPKGGGKPR
jgi:hypothetical protein